MESIFDKYLSGNKAAADHIANINSYIDWNYDTGRELLVKEIEDLQRRIDRGNAPAIFSNKKEQLITLGKCIEKLHETYHFNRDN